MCSCGQSNLVQSQGPVKAQQGVGTTRSCRSRPASPHFPASTSCSPGHSPRLEAPVVSPPRPAPRRGPGSHPDASFSLGAPPPHQDPECPHSPPRAHRSDLALQFRLGSARRDGRGGICLPPACARGDLQPLSPQPGFCKFWVPVPE